LKCDFRGKFLRIPTNGNGSTSIAEAVGEDRKVAGGDGGAAGDRQEKERDGGDGSEGGARIKDAQGQRKEKHHFRGAK
jgi:hypothetical protein